MEANDLKKFPIFETLSLPHLRILARAFTAERHPRGHCVFREGDPGENLYLIEAGSVRITQRLANRGEEALAVLHAGDYFGDMALIDSHPRSADAVVEEDCLLQAMPRPVFLGLLRTDAELTVSIMFQFVRTLTARLRTNNEKIRALNLMAMW